MIDALCGVAPEEDFTLPDGDVADWSVNQVAGWAATKLSALTAQALRANEVDGVLLVELVRRRVEHLAEDRVAAPEAALDGHARRCDARGTRHAIGGHGQRGRQARRRGW